MVGTESTTTGCNVELGGQTESDPIASADEFAELVTLLLLAIDTVAPGSSVASLLKKTVKCMLSCQMQVALEPSAVVEAGVRMPAQLPAPIMPG